MLTEKTPGFIASLYHQEMLCRSLVPLLGMTGIMCLRRVQGSKVDCFYMFLQPSKYTVYQKATRELTVTVNSVLIIVIYIEEKKFPRTTSC